MPNQELLAFIRKWLADGGDPNKLKAELLSADWTEAQVDEALAALGIAASEKEQHEQRPARPQAAPTDEQRKKSRPEPEQAKETAPANSPAPTTQEQPAAAQEPAKPAGATKEEVSAAPSTIKTNVSHLLKNLPGLAAFKIPKHLRDKREQATPATSGQPLPMSHTPPVAASAQKQAPAPANLPVMPEEQQASTNIPVAVQQSAQAPESSASSLSKAPSAQQKEDRATKKPLAASAEKTPSVPTQQESRASSNKTGHSTEETDAPLMSGGFAGPLELLRVAWLTYTERFVHLIGILALPMIVAAFFSVVVEADQVTTLTQDPLAFAALVFFAFAVFVLQAWGQVAALIALKTSQPVTIVEAYSAAWNKIISYWWISILAAFVTIGGLLLFVVPGVVLAVWFSLAFFILVSEDDRGMAALIKSREYVRNHWWGTFGRFIVIGSIAFLFSTALGIGLSLVPVTVPYLEETSFALLNLLLVPFVLAYGFSLYRSLKAQKSQPLLAPTAGKKASYLLVGLLGYLLIPGMLLGVAFLTLDDARQALEQAEQAAQQ